MVVFCCLSLACKDAETENWFCLFVNKEHFFPCTGTSSHRWVCWQCDRDTTDVCEPQVHRHWTTRSHGGHEEGGSSGHFLQRYETFFSHSQKIFLSSFLPSECVSNSCLLAVRSINSIFLDGVLPKCLYKPTYAMKGQTVKRYNGLYLVRSYFTLVFFKLSMFQN